MTYALRPRILVTGGGGFIGSHLCERLVAAGNYFLCVENFFFVTHDNVAHLRGDPHVERLRHDVIEPLRLVVDRIFNLACPANPVHYRFNPAQTVKTSVHGAINMQASTSEIYGDPARHPQIESSK